MSTLSCGDDSRRAQMARHADGASGDPSGAGLYLTDEVFLYRIVGIAPSETGEMVELEDCYMLDVTRVAIGHFHARRLRVVTATPDND
jgi:hypothetical protein